MPVWSTTPVSQQPHLTLEQWQVHELSDGARVLVGYCIENREGRTSRQIENMDLLTLTCISGSGRVYRLKGKPGHNSDAEYVFNAWKRINREAGSTNVTEEVWQAHLAACDGEGVTDSRSRQ